MSGQLAASCRPAVLRLWTACDLAELRTAAQMAHDFLAGQGWPADELATLDLALAEACSNAVKHAGSAGSGLPVELEVHSDAAGAEFRIHDHTPGFDWPAKVSLPPPHQESGRGLYLMTTLMDSARYFRGSDGNILVLRKARRVLKSPSESPEPPAAADSARRLAESEAVIAEMVEELSSCYESLAAIFHYGAEQSAAVEPREFAARMLRDLLLIVEAEWFVFRLAPEGESRLVVLAASEPAPAADPLPVPDPGVQSRSSELVAALARQRVWFDPGRPLDADDPLSRARPGSAGVVHPVLLGGRLVGTLALGRTPRSRQSPAESDLAFSAAQTNIITTFADFLAIQVVNTGFQETRLQQRLVAHELEIANNIQRSLLAGSLPQIPGFTLDGLCRCAHGVGGDFYDVLRIGDRALLLIIADVMGKGIPAALFAASLRTLLRAAPELTRQPGALLARVNSLLFAELSGVDMFITAQLACVDADSRRLALASAGHCPLLLASPGGVASFSAEGVPLGVVADASFTETIVDLPPDFTALLYTDGVTEARNASGGQFGDQRLRDWLARANAADRHAARMKDALARELESCNPGAPLNDDQTFLIITG
jgi:serine phosphatase RsbU (regulator of sigma subunit)/anti-sigma regulatory factor (Ser/Thr protein kinase)